MKTAFIRISRFSALLALAAAAVAMLSPRAGAETGGDNRYGDYLAGHYAATQMRVSDSVDFLLRALEEDPDNVELLRDTLNQSVLAGRYSALPDLARRLVAVEEDSGLAHMILLLEDVRNKDYRAARKSVTRARDAGASRQIELIVLAWTHVAEGDLNLGLVKLGELRQLLRHQRFYIFNRAAMLDFAGSEGEALEAYRAAFEELGGADDQLNRRYRYLLERLGRTEALLEVLNTEISRWPDDYYLYRERERISNGELRERHPITLDEAMGELMFALGKTILDNQDRSSPMIYRAYSTASIYIRLALYMDPDLVPAQMSMAHILEFFGDKAGARAQFEAVPQSSPRWLTAQISLAEMRAREDDVAGAAELLLELEDDHPRDRELLSSLADILRLQERYAESAEVLTRLIDLYGTLQERHWRILYARGIAYDQAGEWSKAEEDFLAALELNPHEPDVLNYLGYSWVDRRENLDRARAMIERAVEDRPNSGYIVDSLGWAMYQLGNYEEAVESLERAVMLEPGDPTINEHLGDAYWKVGRKREARYQWSHALALDPEKDRIASIKDKLRDGMASLE